MIISREQEADRKALEDVLTIMEIAARRYEPTGDERILSQLEAVNEAYDELKQKVEGDYQDIERRAQRVYSLIDQT